MGMPKWFRFFLWLFMIVAVLEVPRGSEARTLVLKDHQKGTYNLTSFAATLGIVCKCCDGSSGECRSTWDASCPKLQMPSVEDSELRLNDIMLRILVVDFIRLLISLSTYSLVTLVYFCR
ncbi:hypothetical protein CJ030_MR3G014787 [Morella rubra]|uniref:Uncharacterized protein n=1 Tax=Morella rubra TaxID=262757 RepID=A0A6A1VYM7_9ROSI|nr:hypothetical protein CJ030_MR3G014787 [Morella rubra]